MIWVLGLSVLSNVAVVAVFVRYLLVRDREDFTERQLWASRVQSPDVAVMQAGELLKEPEPEVKTEKVYVETLP